MSTRQWWDSGRSPRQYAEAILAMGDDKERQRNFFDTHVPEHLKEMTMDDTIISAKVISGSENLKSHA